MGRRAEGVAPYKENEGDRDECGDLNTRKGLRNGRRSDTKAIVMNATI
jgi:hypothetical protein